MAATLSRRGDRAAWFLPGERLEGAGVFVFGLAVVALSAGAAGGVRPTASGWMAVVLLWVAAVALLVRDPVELDVFDLVLAGGLVAFTAWVALSSLWTPSLTSTAHEVQRCLAYTGLVGSALLLVRRATATHLLGGVLGGITSLCAYALATRLLPDRFDGFEETMAFGYRLAGPITSWNALAVFAAMGFLLALGFAARGRALAGRTLAAALSPLLAATMYFTFSRGAWLSVTAGLLVAFAVDARRLQLLAVALVVAPWAALVVAVASRLDGLVSVDASLEQATTDGRTLLWVVVAASVGAAATAAAFALLERRVDVPTAVRTAAAAAIVAMALVGLAAVWAKEGSPVQLAERGWHAFDSSPGGSSNLTGRLFQLSSNSRLAYWRVAWHRFEDRPLVGNGAGTYWQMYAADRKSTAYTKEGHNLYLETLAELGLPGLVLLLVGLAAPLAAGVAARRQPVVSAALAAYVALLVHAAVDPDWELVGVTAAGLMAASGVVAAARRPGRGPTRLRLRVPLAIGLVLLAAGASVELMGDVRLASARAALDGEQPRRGLAEARRAAGWVRWSSEPYAAAGDAYAQLGNREQARREYELALQRDPDSWFLWQALVPFVSGTERRHAVAMLERLNPIAADDVRNPPRLG